MIRSATPSAVITKPSQAGLPERPSHAQSLSRGATKIAVRIASTRYGHSVAGILANLSRNAQREADNKKVKVVRKFHGDDGSNRYQIVSDFLIKLKTLV